MSAPRQKLDLKTEISAAASRWRKEMLDLLNVKYDRSMIIPFKFDGMKLPAELQHCMSYHVGIC